MNTFRIFPARLIPLLLLAVGTAQAQPGLTPAIPKSIGSKPISQTDMGLLVNTASLGSQPTASYQGVINTGNIVAPKAGSTGQYTLPGMEATNVSAKPGKYGISYNATAVFFLYQDRILSKVDDLIEAQSVNLNPGSNDVTEYIIKKSLEKIGTLEAQNGGNKNLQSGYYPNGYYDLYDRFVQSMRQQLAGVNYADLMQGNLMSFLAPIIYKSTNDQCISFCEYPMLDWGNKADGKSAAAYLAGQIFYLFSYQNAAKLDNPIFKSLYDAHTAKQGGKARANYAPLANYHGTSVPFVLYYLPFGDNTSSILNSKNAGLINVFWDSECQCPSQQSFTNAFQAKQTSFIVP
jgi:hypothetical protein